MSARLTKAQRLAVACAVAPTVRRLAHEEATAATKGRRPPKPVAIVDAETGEVIGYRPRSEVQAGLLERIGVEIEVRDGERPKAIVCAKCGAVVPVKARKQRGGTTPRYCPPGECKAPCATEGCRGVVRSRRSSTCLGCKHVEARGRLRRMAEDRRGKARPGGRRGKRSDCSSCGVALTEDNRRKGQCRLCSSKARSAARYEKLERGPVRKGRRPGEKIGRARTRKTEGRR